MYTLKLSSNYYVPLNYYSDQESGSFHNGMPAASFNKLGNFRLSIPGRGEVVLIDIAQRKISDAPFMNKTWGVLIASQGNECEYRYEGGGEISLNVTDLGQIELSTSPDNGIFLLTDMPSFIVKPTPVQA